MHTDRQHGARSELSSSIASTKCYKQPIAHTGWHVELTPELHTSLPTNLTDLPYEPTTSPSGFARRYTPSSLTAYARLPASVTKSTQRRCRSRTNAAPTPHDRRRNAPRARERTGSRRQPLDPRALRSTRPLRLRCIHDLLHCLQRAPRRYRSRWQRSTLWRAPARGYTPHIFTAAP